MKCNWLLFVLVIDLCYVNADIIEKEEKEDDDQDEKYIYKPCKTDEIDCIINFMTSFGQCMAKYKHKPEYDGYEEQKDVEREKQILYLSHFGLTVVLTDSTIKGLDEGKISTFYLNKKTDNLVIGVDFKKVSISSKLAYFMYHQKGQEPEITKDYVNITYSVSLTAVVPIHAGISMKDARVTAHQPMCLDFYNGPKLNDEKKSFVSGLYNTMVSDIPTAIEEAFLTEGPSLFFAYIQKYICDFGIPISA